MNLTAKLLKTGMVAKKGIISQQLVILRLLKKKVDSVSASYVSPWGGERREEPYQVTGLWPCVSFLRLGPPTRSSSQHVQPLPVPTSSAFFVVFYYANDILVEVEPFLVSEVKKKMIISSASHRR